jgi:septum formation protein
MFDLFLSFVITGTGRVAANTMNKPIILASASPRRRELLRQVGLSFKTAPAHVDERVLAAEQPEMYAARLAQDKACAAMKKFSSGIIIAADTVVIIDSEILGKPVDAADAERMLSMLSGNMHRVITGLAVIDVGTGKMLTRTAITKVWFRNLSREEIDSYVTTREPLDKAGAYGIQGKGALLVERIDGCYFNVVGLPLVLLSDMLKEFEVRLI